MERFGLMVERLDPRLVYRRDGVEVSAEEFFAGDLGKVRQWRALVEKVWEVRLPAETRFLTSADFVRFMSLRRSEMIVAIALDGRLRVEQVGDAFVVKVFDAAPAVDAGAGDPGLSFSARDAFTTNDGRDAFRAWCGVADARSVAAIRLARDEAREEGQFVVPARPPRPRFASNEYLRTGYAEDKDLAPFDELLGWLAVPADEVDRLPAVFVGMCREVTAQVEELRRLGDAAETFVAYRTLVAAARRLVVRAVGMQGSRRPAVDQVSESVEEVKPAFGPYLPWQLPAELRTIPSEQLADEVSRRIREKFGGELPIEQGNLVKRFEVRDHGVIAPEGVRRLGQAVFAPMSPEDVRKAQALREKPLPRLGKSSTRVPARRGSSRNRTPSKPNGSGLELPLARKPRR